MNIFEILREEHDNISKFVDKFEIMAIDLMEKNEISIEEYTKAIEFIRVYADKTHHQKEEELLLLWTEMFSSFFFKFIFLQYFGVRC